MLTLFNGFDRSLTDELRRMDRLFGEMAPARRARYLTATFPAVDIVETDDAVEITAEVPAFAVDDISVTLHEGELKLEGRLPEKPAGDDAPRRKVLIRERQRVAFTRTFRLRVELDETKVHATVKDGLLTVVLPKAEPSKPKQIPVTVQ